MLLGARQFFERRGAPTPSVPTARDYVQDGLIAMWDGIENAGWGTHDGNASSWKDLIGTHDMSCIGVYEFEDKYIHFKSQSSYGNAAFDSSIQSLMSNGWTDEAVFFDVPVYGASGTVNGVSTIISSGLYVISSLMPFYMNAQNFNRTYYQQQLLGTFSLVKGQSNIAYKNAESIGTFTSNVPSGTSSNNGICLNKREGYVNYGCGDLKVCCRRIYSRALTAAEVAANYAIDKARFNLP